MATSRPFPSIKPSSRSYSPGTYPSTDFESLDGTKTHIRYGNKRVNATLSLGFSNITDQKAAEILDHYQAVNSVWDYVTFSQQSGTAGGKWEHGWQQEWVDSGNGWAVGVGGQRELEALGGEGSGTMDSGSQGMER